MKLALAILLVVHGLLHLLGAAKGLRLAEVTSVSSPISVPLGALWLGAGLSLMLSAAALFVWPVRWWAIGAVALVLSQAAIFSAWPDAKFGTLANVILLGSVVYHFASYGPRSFQRQYRRAATQLYNQARPDPALLTDADLVGLPPSIQRYVEQAARMRVKLFSLVPVVDARGPEMTRAETVTLLNDLCVFAPGALAFAGIEWRVLKPDLVAAMFTHAGHRVSALLSFNAAGELVDFVSDDRAALSKDGRSLESLRWSTPLNEYAQFGTHRLARRGEGVWHDPSGAYSYIQLELLSIEYNTVPTSPESAS